MLENNIDTETTRKTVNPLTFSRYLSRKIVFFAIEYEFSKEVSGGVAASCPFRDKYRIGGSVQMSLPACVPAIVIMF